MPRKPRATAKSAEPTTDWGQELAAFGPDPQPPEPPAPPASDEPGRLAAARAALERLATWVPIRSLARRHRRRIVDHLLSLTPQDRYLRFGYGASDEQIRHYAQGIDFNRDEVLGIFNRRLQLVALAHLAYGQPLPGGSGRTMAEFGVSVLAQARGRGLGRRLFDTAALHARNRGIDTMFIHALSENRPMLRIATAAGATVERDGSESEAWLRLPPDTVGSQVEQALDRHLGELDFQFKRQARALSDFVDSVAEVKSHFDTSGRAAKE
ncbi:GNAT family N-acetyltransferase [Roseateles asaccharophilus]|uniref:GNAT superfamily N-acetyltransferase n=1 Tax=Roseateles asaccharophilus TaxID=582607 RepID=A0ABU2A1F3_9BURK|nr:GNAT family N-acetyltransferase [Roseateles asaccharophilus]MDR7331021.1 GNAT superfamily N-acetyltransferase [Roseateles asaccharophilus]